MVQGRGQLGNVFRVINRELFKLVEDRYDTHDGLDQVADLENGLAAFLELDGLDELGNFFQDSQLFRQVVGVVEAGEVPEFPEIRRECRQCQHRFCFPCVGG